MRSSGTAVLTIGVLLALTACESNTSDAGLGAQPRSVDQDISATHGGAASLDDIWPGANGPRGGYLR